ncbi:Ribokinase-like protein, partial [Chlamydoabsidia padenii]
MLQRQLLVIGGAALDITATATKRGIPTLLHTSTPGSVRHALGGVGRNVCEAAMRVGASCMLLSATGDDVAGSTLRHSMTGLGMGTSLIDTLPSQSTAVYNAFHDTDGQLVAAVADMAIFDHLDLSKLHDVFTRYKPSLVCMDGNITAKAMEIVASTCQTFGVPAFFEPTSIPKSLKIFQGATQIGSIQYTSPNQYELEAMVDQVKSQFGLQQQQQQQQHSLTLPSNAPPLAHQSLDNALYLSNYIPQIILKLGEYGCVYVSGGDRSVRYYAPELLDPSTVKSVTGAGDSFVGAVLANLLKDPLTRDMAVWDQIIRNGQRAAIRTLQSDLAVGPTIDQDLLL